MLNTSQADFYMQLAIRQAEEAVEAGDVPVGAVIVHSDKIIARAHNQTELLKDPTAHAEMIAITQAAAAIGDWRLTECALYVTKEPCPMCAGAITLARIPSVFFGAHDPQSAGHLKAEQIEGGILEKECKELLQIFFKKLRNKSKGASPKQVSDACRNRKPNPNSKYC